MKKRTAVVAALLALAATPSAAQESAKIGFVATFSGPAAVIGNDMRDGFELALDHLGRKVGGLAAQVIYEDDQQKPEVGKQKTDKLIGSDRVSFLTGYIWSNVLLASLKPAVDAQTFLISANAGPSQIAGELCSPWFFSVSWQGDQVPQAIGEYLNQKGVKSAFLIAPNYAAGKDVVAGGTSRARLPARNIPNGRISSTSPWSWRRRAPPSLMPSSHSIPAPPASSSSPNIPRPASRRRYRSTPPSSSTACRCRGSASSRSEFPAPSTG
jgi:hypothetical protein